MPHRSNTRPLLDLDIEIVSELKFANVAPQMLVVFDRLDGLELMRKPRRLTGYVLVLCREGAATAQIDLQRRRLTRHKALLLKKGQILKVEQIGEDFRPLCVFLADNWFERTMYRVPNLSRVIRSVKDYGIISLSEAEYSLMENAVELLRSQVCFNYGFGMKPQVLEYTTISTLCQIVSFTFKHKGENRPASSRKEQLFNEFQKLLLKYHTGEHAPSFYADRLCVSTKYLSAVCEEVSGKSCKRWIDEQILLEAEVMLRRTDATILQISEQLNFKDASNFGKYFRRLTGVSPKDYRK